MAYSSLTQTQIQDLYKTLSSNNFGQLNLGATGGAAIIPESLENSLKTLTFTEGHLKLWRDIPKSKAFSNVEEYNVVDSYGEDVPGFQPEGVAGLDTTSSYKREYAKVKCLNVTRSVTDLMRLVNTVSEPEALETQNGMKYVLGQAESALFYGDSTLAPAGEEGLQWDGVFKQLANENVFDLRGKHLEDTHLNEAATAILDNYGTPTKAYLPMNVAQKFSEQYYPNQRALMSVESGEMVAGTTVTKFNTLGGTIDLTPDVFLRRGMKALDTNEPAYGNEPPTAPTVTAAVGEEDPKNPAKFGKGGTFKYAVVAYSHKGKSVAVVSDAVAVQEADGKKGVKLTIKNSDTQIHAPEYFVIYRTEDSGSQFYEIGRVGAKSRDKSAVTEFIDRNEVLPNTGEAVIGQFDESAITFRQLLPAFKLPYAMTGPVRRFGIFLYGTPIIYAPKRFVTIKNIKID